MHTDHLGTPRAINNNSNEVLWRWEGDQFGDVLPTGKLIFRNGECTFTQYFLENLKLT